MKRKTLTIVAGLTIACAAAAPAQSRNREALGSEVVVERSNAGSLRGELIAVTADTLWILTQQQLMRMPMQDVLEVRIDRRKMGAKLAWTWSLAAGAISGLLLTAACSSVTEDCGGVFVFTMGSWAIFGLLSAPSMESVRYQSIEYPRDNSRWQQLRAESRFPVGIPDGYSVIQR